MRKVIVAPTAFKGTLGPSAVARALSAGVTTVWPEASVIELPLADGGNGTLESYRALRGGRLETLRVSGPLGARVSARLLRTKSDAVIESAEACGLHLVPPGQRDPLRASTFGVGELVLAGARGGSFDVILGLGGSATVDGGTGMARALGWRFLDARGRPLPEGGGALRDLAHIEPPARELEATALALCDVDNPLSGRLGAARVYGPQKGAGSDEVEALEAGLVRLAEVLESQHGLTPGDLPGAGAAGGLGFGARAFLGADLVSGAVWMIERAGLVESLAGAGLVITGEGRYDLQSGMGKVTGRVMEAARSALLPVLLVCGRIAGPIPPGVLPVDGGGRQLTANDLALLTGSGCRAIAGEDRL
ncbi:MAG: glycerate kinase [Gemmatimonadota bacterium]|nr:MAG: glycerate kinase [Gemmatimonadota bacterium]